MNEKTKGTLIFTIAMLISGTIGLFVRLIELPSIEIVFYRCLIGATVLGLYVITFEKRELNKILNKKFLVFLSSLILVFNWVFLFSAFKHTSISIAISIYYLAPIFVILYGIIILKEKDIKIKLLTIIIAFIGAIFVSNISPTTQNSNFLGIFYALLAALLYASLIIIAKRLKDISPALLAFVQTAIGVAILIFFIPDTFSHIAKINSEIIEILIILGAIHTALMYILFFKGIHLAPISVVALLGFLDPLVAVLIDFTILDSKLTFMQWIGVFLIMAALIFKTLYELKKSYR